MNRNNYSIDFVPSGIFTKVDSGDRFFIIPNENGRIQTEPTIDKMYIKEIAKVFSQFKNVNRLIKYLRDNYDLDICSYAIECAMVHFVLKAKGFTDDFELDFINFLNYLVSLIEKGISQICETQKLLQ